MVRDSRNAHDDSIWPVVPVLQVTWLRIWGTCPQLLSRPCRNVRSVPPHGTLSAVEFLYVDDTASRELCTWS